MSYRKAKAKSYRDLYPTGRKHCSKCRRWRSVVDFGVSKWVDIERTVPLKLASSCRTCDSRRIRERDGYQRRDVYAHGVPGSPQYQEEMRAMKRELHRKRIAQMTPKEYRAYLDNKNELSRFARNAKGIRSRGRERSEYNSRINPEPRYDPAPFFGWLFNNRKTIDNTLVIGAYITESERREIDNVKSGTFSGIRLSTVDAIMSRAGDGYLVSILYPIEQAA